MVPERFCVEFLARSLQLLVGLEQQAAQMGLATTFIVSFAMPLIVVPLERLATHHKLWDENDRQLSRELNKLKARQFQHTPFWNAADALGWRFHILVGDVDDPRRWTCEAGHSPFREPAAAASSRSTSFADIIYTLRHSLAHGCVIYLDEQGEERPNRPVTQIAFISDTPAKDGRHRLLVVHEEAFKRFLIRWAEWLQQYQSARLRLAA